MKRTTLRIKQKNEFKRMIENFPCRSIKEWALCFGVKDAMIRNWIQSLNPKGL
jgi:hypothetical protein